MAKSGGILNIKNEKKREQIEASPMRTACFGGAIPRGRTMCSLKRIAVRQQAVCVCVFNTHGCDMTRNRNR